ncbi:MAG: aminoacetone oxidase family FAD-binding enzyme [Acidobacteria bacterium]|nr:aminoacetone oxidase family FAD-binding enzyme [Acidobacteriota bacterium]
MIIGGGAAGLFCAIEAGKRGRTVLVIEHQERVGKKIAISGGGRCNFTNILTAPENFLSANPHFCKSALARYTPADFVTLVEKHNVAYYEKKLGQLFCRDSSQQIIDLLLRECAEAGVKIRCGCRVLSVHHANGFTVETNQGSFVASSLVIATGGLSIAPLGASDFGYQVARQFGLRIEEAKPALVPFTLTAAVQKALAPISGISLDALVKGDDKEFRENILITHRGLSGPAILQVSLYWQKDQAIRIDLLPDEDVFSLLKSKQGSEIELANLLSQHLPRRFAQAWCDLYARSRPLKQFSIKELAEIAGKIHEFRITPAGTEGFKKAEVTAGGVATSELSSQTMEAGRMPGLYFIGEVVDVTGQLGGYNFQWAWASGFAAGQTA